MDNKKINLDEFRIWNRKIVNAYWIVSLLYIIGQVLFLIIDISKDPNFAVRKFLIRNMLIPDVIILFILLSTELCFKYSKKLNKYLIIATSTAIAYTAFFSITHHISGRLVVLIIPILISVFYFSKKVLIATCSMVLSIIWLIYIFSPYQRGLLSIFELIIITISSICAGIIGVGIVSRGIHLLNSITTLVKNEEKLIIEKSLIDKLSKTDALTGLYNHRTFHEYTDTLLNQKSIYSFQLQLAIIDIDDFKKVNDTYGHWSGDIVLKETANIIQSSVTPDDFVARYGGEEFAIIFLGKSLTDTLSILETLRETISKRVYKELENKSITVSTGVHNYFNKESKELLFKYADGALYKAKASGKNKIICSP